MIFALVSSTARASLDHPGSAAWGGRRKSRKGDVDTLKRAAELFVIDEWRSDSGFVEKAWTSYSQPEPAFVSIAVSRWQIVVTTQRELTQFTVRGPETKATVTPIPADAEFFGIVFNLGTFMPAIPLASLVDRAMMLPVATPSSVWLDGSRWEIPTPGNADVFVDRLVRQGLIVRDPVVAESLRADVDSPSKRTLQRRVARATGLTRSTIRQIARAGKAVEALGGGLSPQDAATLLGYADQAHLTRSLKRFVGQTPAQCSTKVVIGRSIPRLPPACLVIGSCRFRSIRRFGLCVACPQRRANELSPAAVLQAVLKEEKDDGQVGRGGVRFGGRCVRGSRRDRGLRARSLDLRVRPR